MPARVGAGVNGRVVAYNALGPRFVALLLALGRGGLACELIVVLTLVFVQSVLFRARMHTAVHPEVRGSFEAPTACTAREHPCPLPFPHDGPNDASLAAGVDEPDVVAELPTLPAAAGVADLFPCPFCARNYLGPSPLRSCQMAAWVE